MTLERNQVYCMDALELLRQLDDASVDCIVTSPPYDNLRTYNGYSWDFEGIARDSYRVLKDGGVMVWVVGDATIDGSETLTSFRQALYFKDVVGFRMHDTMIYNRLGTPHHAPNRYIDEAEYMFVLTKGAPQTVNLQTQKKVNFNQGGSKITPDGGRARFVYENTTNERVRGNVWAFFTGNNHTTKDDVDHPAMFPEALAERHILTWSNPGDLVLDFFGGSGTTAKMARANGRDYITGDISEEYCDLMRRRLALPYTLPMFEAVRP
mgnify:CR=1 FL=1